MAKINRLTDNTLSHGNADGLTSSKACKTCFDTQQASTITTRFEGPRKASISTVSKKKRVRLAIVRPPSMKRVFSAQSTMTQIPHMRIVAIHSGIIASIALSVSRGSVIVYQLIRAKQIQNLCNKRATPYDMDKKRAGVRLQAGDCDSLHYKRESKRGNALIGYKKALTIEGLNLFILPGRQFCWHSYMA